MIKYVLVFTLIMYTSAMSDWVAIPIDTSYANAWLTADTSGNRVLSCSLFITTGDFSDTSNYTTIRICQEWNQNLIYDTTWIVCGSDSLIFGITYRDIGFFEVVPCRDQVEILGGK